MMHFKGDCVVLEGVTCSGQHHQYCPRSIYPYWREIWLRRVNEPSALSEDGFRGSTREPVTLGGLSLSRAPGLKGID